VTNVVGAVPVIVVLGLAVAVPPEMLQVVPAAETAGWNQVVTKVNTVLDVAAAVVLIYSPVYGDAVLLSWNMVAGVDVS
jgi:hypothetical protein